MISVGELGRNIFQTNGISLDDFVLFIGFFHILFRGCRCFCLCRCFLYVSKFRWSCCFLAVNKTSGSNSRNAGSTWASADHAELNGGFRMTPFPTKLRSKWPTRCVGWAPTSYQAAPSMLFWNVGLSCNYVLTQWLAAEMRFFWCSPRHVRLTRHFPGDRSLACY